MYKIISHSLTYYIIVKGSFVPQNTWYIKSYPSNKFSSYRNRSILLFALAFLVNPIPVGLIFYYFL